MEITRIKHLLSDKIGCPDDLSGIHAGMTDLNHCYDPNYSHGPKFPANLPARRAQALSSLAPNARAKRRGGKAPLRSQMHNPRPLERWVGLPAWRWRRGCMAFALCPFHHGGLSLALRICLTSYEFSISSYPPPLMIDFITRFQTGW